MFSSSRESRVIFNTVCLHGTRCHKQHWPATLSVYIVFKSRLKTFFIHWGFRWTLIRPATGACEAVTAWRYINSINIFFYIHAVNPLTRHLLPIHIPVLRPTLNGPAERRTRATSWFCVRYSALFRIPCSFARKKNLYDFYCFFSLHFIFRHKKDTS